ncbi:hypothetical protein ACOMHN_055090 [Nucella lapillus]
MTILVMRRLRASESTACLSVYFTALAVSDLCLLTISMIFNWPERSFGIPVKEIHHVTCITSFFVLFVTSMTSAWFLMAMTGQRMISVILPHRVGVLCTVRRAKIITAVLVTTAIVSTELHIAPLVVWHQSTQRHIAPLVVWHQYHTAAHCTTGGVASVHTAAHCTTSGVASVHTAAHCTTGGVASVPHGGTLHHWWCGISPHSGTLHHWWCGISPHSSTLHHWWCGISPHSGTLHH